MATTTLYVAAIVATQDEFMEEFSYLALFHP